MMSFFTNIVLLIKNHSWIIILQASNRNKWREIELLVNHTSPNPILPTSIQQFEIWQKRLRLGNGIRQFQIQQTEIQQNVP